jgi:hypothetical protein
MILPGKLTVEHPFTGEIQGSLPYTSTALESS